MQITLIQGGDVYAPEPRGRQDILAIGHSIARIGTIDATALEALEFDIDVVDAKDCVVVPGLIDPHVHLTGGGGESGFTTRTPPAQLGDLLAAGVTTVVGCLGTDGVTRHPLDLLAKARALDEEGVSTFIYTGNYQVPPPTLTGSVRSDLVIVDKVVGVGEIAISDRRGTQPSAYELARLVAEATVGGMLSGKAGVTHFHTGSGKQRLRLLHALLDDYDILPDKLYATHITRSETLVDDAIVLAQRGAYVDMDTTEGDLAPWLAYYRDHGGSMERLTISSDGNGSLPREDESGRIVGVERVPIKRRYEQLTACVVEHGWALADLLPLVTSNVANVLHLKGKGRLMPGMDADIVVARRDTLEIVDLWARGRRMIKSGSIVTRGTFEG